MKRISDILISFIMLGILFPFMILISLLILISNGQPVFFIQNRLGKNKKNFRLIKFRSMKNGEIYPFGSLMRRTGLDEIPQLWNILKGEMSFIGPRPLTMDDIVRLGWDKDFYLKRWTLKPGLTGLAQLSPVCHVKLSWFFDQYYIKKHSFILDMKIIFASALVPLLGKERVKKNCYR